MNDSVKTLLGSIGENNRFIKVLLKEKNKKIREVQSLIEHKARTKTPLNESQQHMFIEFTGVFAAEGGLLKESLMSFENTIRNNLDTQTVLHTDNALFQFLTTLQYYQRNAIHSLRRMIASGEKTLDSL